MAPARPATRWERLADFSVRRSRPMLALVALATLCFSYFLVQIEADTSILAFVRPAARQLVETIEDDFGEGSYLTLIFESRSDRSLLEPELLHQQLRILKEIQQSYRITSDSLVEGIDEGLRRIKHKSLLDYDDYSTIAEAILALSGGRTIEDLEKVSAHFVSHPDAIRFYARLRIAAGALPIDPPGVPDTTYRIPYVKAIKSLVRLDNDYPRRDRKRLLAGIRDLGQTLATPEIAVYAVNDDLISHDIDVHGQRNALLLGLMVLVVDALCVVALFRSRRELLVILTILVTSCIWTYGLAGMLGIRLSFLHLLGLPVLLGTGIDDTFVFGRRLAEERALGKPFAEAMRATFAGVGNAIFLTTFTTFVAFLVAALAAPATVVLSFYLLVSASMLVVLLLCTFLQGALRAELSRRERGPAEGAATAPVSLLDTTTRRLTRLSCRLIARGARPTLLVCGALFVLAVGSAARLESELARTDFLQPGMPTKRANAVQEQYFGPSKVGYVVFTGDVENPVLLRKMAILERSLAGNPLIEQVLGKANVESVLGLMRKLGIGITPTLDVRSAFDRISSDQRTANYVLDTRYGEALEQLVRKNGERYDGLLMRFFVAEDPASFVIAAARAIREQVQQLELDRIPGVEVEIGGGDITLGLESVYYEDAMVISFFVSLLCNYLVLVVAWRRPWPALLAMAPLLLAGAVVMGAMPLFGVTLTPVNLTIGAIVVGLGIDYPIHIMERFEEERREGGLPPQEAAEAALTTMGPHILAGMLTTSIGFCASCVLLLPLSQSFGLLTGAAVAFVYFTSIFALPVLLVAMDARGWIGGRPPAALASSPDDGVVDAMSPEGRDGLRRARDPAVPRTAGRAGRGRAAGPWWAPGR